MKLCTLCSPESENVIFKNDLFRVILVDDKFYPGFIRLILNQHVKEMSDLSSKESSSIFTALITLEKQLRLVFNPDKINLASLGNIVPHLHWHIIPRYVNDRHFPNPIWGNIVHKDYIPAKHLFELQDSLLISLNQQLNNLI